MPIACQLRVDRISIACQPPTHLSFFSCLSCSHLRFVCYATTLGVLVDLRVTRVSIACQSRVNHDVGEREGERERETTGGNHDVSRFKKSCMRWVVLQVLLSHTRFFIFVACVVPPRSCQSSACCAGSCRAMSCHAHYARTRCAPSAHLLRT